MLVSKVLEIPVWKTRVLTSTKCSNQIVNLARRCTSNRVRNTNTVHANLVDGAVDGQKVDQIGPERVLGAETDLLALALDELDDLESGVLYVGPYLSQTIN
jgi:hypothetical protein